MKVQKRAATVGHAGLLAGLLATATLALAANPDPEKGSGNVITQTRPTGTFTAIRLASIGTLVVEQTGIDSVAVTTDDNLQTIVTSEIKDGTLVLAEAGCRNCSPTKIAFKVTVSALKEIELSSTGSAEVFKLDAPTFSASLSGTGSLKLSGKVDELKIMSGGTGSCDAAELVANRATVVVSGTSSVRVNATAELNAKVSGVGKIQYLGTPKVTQTISGLGRIEAVTK